MSMFDNNSGIAISTDYYQTKPIRKSIDKKNKIFLCVKCGRVFEDSNLVKFYYLDGFPRLGLEKKTCKYCR